MTALALSLWALLAGAEAPAPAPGPAPGPAAAAAEVARAEPSRTAVGLGEPFDYAVALRHGLEETVELVAPPDLAPFVLQESSCRDTRGEKGALTVCTLRLQLLDLGDREVPALQLRLKGPGGERLVPAPGARVRGLGTTDPRTPAASLPLRTPAAPPVEVPSWRVAGWAGAALLLATLGWLLWRSRRGRARGRESPPTLPPHQRFARRVDEIVALDLPGRGRGREHVDRLADAVREVLAAVAPQAHLDLTSAELLAALASRPAAGVDAAALSGFLAEADLVKFARHQPSAAACQAATGFAQELAQRLRPPPPQEVAA